MRLVLLAGRVTRGGQRFRVWRWVLVHTNGAKLAQGEHRYRHRAELLSAVETITGRTVRYDYRNRVPLSLRCTVFGDEWPIEVQS